MNTKTIPNIINLVLLEKLIQQINNSGWKYGWRSTRDKTIPFAHWHQDLKQKDADEVGLIAEISQSLQKQYFQDSYLLKSYVNAHSYGTEGYPHIDSTIDGDQTLVVYLNKEWKKEWGGESLIYDNDDIIFAQLPKFNTGLLFNSELWHCARGVTRICPEIRTTLVFKFAKKTNDC
jgi:Rps23 Pro-64 3,4-dihydroxylase Tpa1-like proline 4-hydroxylase